MRCAVCDAARNAAAIQTTDAKCILILHSSCERDFLIVGLGVSADGAEALEGFFAHLPGREIDAAYVVVGNDVSDRNGSLVELIARCTELEVRIAVEGEEVRSRCIYVSPACSVLALEGSRLRVRAHRDDNPIDSFFSTLGRDQREHAVGIILSGAGSDGASGLEIIKNEGGFTIAQAHRPGKRYPDDMPRVRDAVDAVLPIEQIGTRVRDHARSLRPSLEVAANRARQSAGKNLSRRATSSNGCSSRS